MLGNMEILNNPTDNNYNTPRQNERSNGCMSCCNHSERVQPISDITISQNTDKSIILSEKNQYYVIDGIVGIYNINNSIFNLIINIMIIVYYLAVITKSKDIDCELENCKIFSIEDLKYIILNKKKKSSKRKTILKNIKKLFCNGSFYYSYNYNLTCNLQKYEIRNKIITSYKWKDCDDMFIVFFRLFLFYIVEF